VEIGTVPDSRLAQEKEEVHHRRRFLSTRTSSQLLHAHGPRICNRRRWERRRRLHGPGSRWGRPGSGCGPITEFDQITEHRARGPGCMCGKIGAARGQNATNQGRGISIHPPRQMWEIAGGHKVECPRRGGNGPAAVREGASGTDDPRPTRNIASQQGGASAALAGPRTRWQPSWAGENNAPHRRSTSFRAGCWACPGAAETVGQPARSQAVVFPRRGRSTVGPAVRARESPRTRPRGAAGRPTPAITPRTT